VVRLSFACRSLVGRLSVACRSLVGRFGICFVLKLYMPVLIFKGLNQFLEYKDYFKTHYT